MISLKYIVLLNIEDATLRYLLKKADFVLLKAFSLEYQKIDFHYLINTIYLEKTTMVGICIR